ncbi:MAG: hypothetical protein LBI61_01460 [Puniceicoccales bacterium]|jgi:hypothetical protein|nr:hypothetical protein [Puniceicoccales bacterium]
MGDKFSDGKVVGLRSAAVGTEQKVFRYGCSRNAEAASVECGIFEGEFTVAVRDDSDAYCDWLETLTGD